MRCGWALGEGRACRKPQRHGREKTQAVRHDASSTSGRPKAPAFRLLDLPQKMLGARNVRLARLRLDVELFHDTVDHEHRVALRAHAKASGGSVKFEAERLG